ncbi:YeeE/YedE family protein [Rhodobacteraceae bacterium NNCM2]|nr:YeeE/YedE family protein [Coraliihabitans acroporae]
MHRLTLIVSVFGLFTVAAAAFYARGGMGGEGVTYSAGALLGAFAGFALYHASFGFTAAWRRLVRERRGSGVRAQVILLGLTCSVTYLLIGYEDLTGWDMHPVVIGMGLSSAIGAFVFGAGMQLGGGCASGTLFTAGGGSTRMVLVLVFFILGSVLATAHMNEFWLRLGDITGVPSLPGTSMIALFGPLGAIAFMALLLGAIWAISVWVERRAHGSVEPDAPTQSLLTGRWSIGAGSVALALVGIGCFLLFQRPWGVTAGFALWGAKILQAFGVPVGEWGYWSGWRAGQLNANVFADRTSVMNFGIVLGAMAAASLAGRFAPIWRLTRREVLTAVIGGLMMGYGARLAYGCNIGAYLGGLASGSMHGWWWLLWGFAGSWLGVGLRRVFEMDPPLAPREAPGWGRGLR